MFLGIDLGTSGVKALLIDENGSIIAQSIAELSIHRPHLGWSEQDPYDWITACESTIDALRAQGAPMGQIEGIGLSGQMHGAVALDQTDTPLRPAILWNDGRAAEFCAPLANTAPFLDITGNLVMAGFTAPKLAWMRAHEPELFAQTTRVLLPKDYLRLWLTGEAVSDMSDAAGTLWLDCAARDWSEELLHATGLSREHMPRLVEGTEISGALRPALAKRWGMKHVIVAGGAGDNAASACGLGVLTPGTGFLSLGTSGVLFAATQSFAPNTKEAVHSFCHAIPKTWHQMGVILAASDALSWWADIVGKTPAALTGAFSTPPEAPSPVGFLPYLSGERTPHNDPSLRGSFFDLHMGSSQSDLTQAVLEGVGFAFADCLDALRASGTKLEQVYVVGGGANSRYWLELIASQTGLTLLCPAVSNQGAALGAAYLARAACNSELSHRELFPTPQLALTQHPNKALTHAFAEKRERFNAKALN